MYTCVVVEDEPLARKKIEKNINNHPNLKLLNSFNKGSDALEFFKNDTCDFLCTDIEMPQLNGMSLASAIDRHSPNTEIVFITAYSAYAVDSYKVNASGYLLKPYSDSEFNELINKLIVKKDKSKSYFFVKINSKLQKILFDDILYFEGLKDYIQIYIRGEKYPKLILSNFKNLLNKLPSDKFIRVHRSYIVNITKIEKIEKNKIVFEKIKIPISVTRKKHFFKLLSDSIL